MPLNNCWHFSIYYQDKLHAQLSCNEHKKFYNLETRVCYILFHLHKVLPTVSDLREIHLAVEQIRVFVEVSC